MLYRLHPLKFFACCCTMLLLASLAAPRAPAAEVRFREVCQCSSGVVRLGDLAEIFAVESQEAEGLAAIELFPAPPPGERRFVRAQQIQDQLLLSKINLAHHRLSGASQIVVVTAAPVSPAAAPVAEAPPRTVSTADLNRATDAVRRAVLRRLKQQAGAEQAWAVTPKIDDAVARSILQARGDVTAAGDCPSAAGVHTFTLTFETANGPAELSIQAEVSPPPSVAVAVRTVARGAIIQPTDIELRPAASAITNDTIVNLADAVGLETTRVIFAGQVVDAQAVQHPILVRRSEVVTIYARAAGVQVRTTGRARDDGSLGSLIEVESLLNRGVIFARVSGPQEVEVYAPPASISAGQ